MKKNIFIIATTICLSLLPSCDFLEIEPTGIMTSDNYYSTERELNIALNGVYGTLSESALYGNYMLGRLGLDCDESYNCYSSDDNSISQYNVSAADNKVLNYWKALYFGIARANLLLENINNAKDITERKRMAIYGEALFLRSYYYLLLVTRFGDVPYVDKVPADGRPASIQMARTKGKIVYERIIADMDSASKLVYPIDSVVSGGRVSKSAAWGILARACLYVSGEPYNESQYYAKAAEYSKRIIDCGKHSLNADYAQVFINYAQDIYDKKESIFEVEFYGNNTGTFTTTAGMVGRNNGIKNPTISNEGIGYAADIMHITETLYNIYDPMDLRRDWVCAPYYYQDKDVQVYWTTGTKFQRSGGKFRREYETLFPKSTTATPQNFPLLRYSDVLLMYAESVISKGNTTGEELQSALTCVNQVRRRGFGRPISFSDPEVDLPSSTTKEDLFEELKVERSRELCHELNRKNDLIRWGNNMFINQMQYTLMQIPTSTSSYLNRAKNYYGNATKRDELWPIPTYELGVNPLLTQNPGW